LINLPNLSENLLGTLNDNNEYHDIIIEVGNDPNAKTYCAHMINLNCRSLICKEYYQLIKRVMMGLWYILN
jgi:hypothetical protein